MCDKTPLRTCCYVTLNGSNGDTLLPNDFAPDGFDPPWLHQNNYSAPAMIVGGRSCISARHRVWQGSG